MTPNEIQAELTALAAEMGPKGAVSITIGNGYRSYLVGRPGGMDGSDYFFIYGDDFATMIQAAREEWATRADGAAENITRELALAIIRITHAAGCCTDAQLRGADFDQADIDRFGPKAVERANDMAASGPFEIIATGGANAEAA